MLSSIIALTLASTALAAPTIQRRAPAGPISKLTFTVPSSTSGSETEVLNAVLFQTPGTSSYVLRNGVTATDYSAAYFQNSSTSTAYNSKGLSFYVPAEGTQPSKNFYAFAPTLRLGDGPAQASNLTAGETSFSNIQFEWDNLEGFVTHERDEANEQFLACRNECDGFYYLAWGTPSSDTTSNGPAYVEGCSSTSIKQVFVEE